MRRVDCRGLLGRSAARRFTLAAVGVQAALLGALACGPGGGEGEPRVGVLRLSLPTGLTVDGRGNLYAAAPDAHRVYRFAATGGVAVVAGNGEAGYAGDGGPAVDAQLSWPSGVAVDAGGNVYIADAGNDRVRRVGPDGTITTIVGTGRIGAGMGGGVAAGTELVWPVGVAVDGAGNVYVADTGNHRVIEVAPSGAVAIVAGTGVAGEDGDRDPAANSELRWPVSVAVDQAGNLYVADFVAGRVRRVSAGGDVTTLAVGGWAARHGHAGHAAAAGLTAPAGVAVAGDGSVYVTDMLGQRVLRVDATGAVSAVAGSGEAGDGGDYGPATAARLSDPGGVAVDAAGNLYVADTFGLRLRRVDPAGIITTVGGAYGGDDGPAVDAHLGYPADLAVDRAGNVYIADTSNHRVRRVDREGTITTIAGTGVRLYSVDGGPAVATGLFRPGGVAVDQAGDVYIADACRLRRVEGAAESAGGTITTIASFPGPPSDLGLWPRLPCNVSRVAVDGAGRVYVPHDYRVSRVDPSGRVTTIAGRVREGLCCEGEGGPATDADLRLAAGVAMDGAGNVYIADAVDHRVRRVDGSGIITTLAGTGEPGDEGDGGPATEARLGSPNDVAVDGAGSVFVADTSNHRVRRVDPSGVIVTVAGTGEAGYGGDGGAATDARLNSPRGVAVDGAGNLYIADTGNRRVRRVDSAGTIVTIAGTRSNMARP